MNIISLSGKCNNNCWSCSDKSNKKKSFDKIKNEISKFISIESILIKGGEPTIHPHFFDLLDYLQKLGYKKIIVITNGRMFSYIDYITKISKYKNVEFLIKLLGHNSLIHDDLTRVDGSFEQTIAGINHLKNKKIRFFVVISVLEQNFVFLEKIISLINCLGVEKTIISTPKPYNNKNYSKVIVPFQEINNILYKLCSEHDFIYFEDIPFCFLGKYKNKSIIHKFSDISESKNKFISKKCEFCLNYELCPKLWSSYFEIYSDDFLTTQKNLPEEIGIEITSKCNLSCKFCFKKNIYPSDYKKDLNFEDIKKIIDKIPPEVSRIRITGGEPLMNKDLFDIIKYIRYKGFKVWLNTNATLITESYANLLSKYIDNVLIPLNGFDEKSEKNFTNHNSLKKKLEGIALLKKHKLNIIRLGTVATKDNILNIEKICSLVLSLGVDNWELYRPISNPANISTIKLDDLRQLSIQLYNINQRFKKNFKIVNAIPLCSIGYKLSNHICEGASADDGHIRFIIGTDFVVRPSYYINERLGDIIDNSINDLWNSPFMKNMRNLKFVPNDCDGCFDILKCKGGSRFSSNLLTGSYNNLDPIMISEKNISISKNTNKYAEYLNSLKRCGQIPLNMHPLTVRIKLTRICNLNCKMCYVKRSKENKNLSFKTIKSLLQDLKKLGTQNIVLTGGEPLIRGDIKKIIEEINRLGLNGTIYTNGTRLTDSFCRLLIKNNWKVMVSIDGHNSTINDKIRGIGTFKKTIFGLRNLIRYRKKYNSGLVFTHTVIQDDNYDYIDDINNFFKNEGVDFTEFSLVTPLKNYFKQRTKFGIDLSDGKHSYLKNSIPYLNLVIPYLINGKIEEDILKDLFKNKNILCLSFDELLIGPNGDVYNCCNHFHEYNFVVGNINQESIKKIWFGKKFNKLRKKLLKPDISSCGGCNKLIDSINLDSIQNE